MGLRCSGGRLKTRKAANGANGADGADGADGANGPDRRRPAPTGVDRRRPAPTGADSRGRRTTTHANTPHTHSLITPTKKTCQDLKAQGRQED